MKRACTLVALALLAGCGSGTISGDELAKDMEAADWKGGKVTGVSCVKKADRVFTCLGEYTVTGESLRASGEMPVDTSDWTDEDWDAMAAGQSGQASWEVTVDESGTWIANAT